LLALLKTTKTPATPTKPTFADTPLFTKPIERFLRDKHPDVPSGHELATREVDLVFGGPPCQGFSQIGPRDFKDSRNLLFLEFARVVEQLRPKTFLMENVPTFRFGQRRGEGALGQRQLECAFARRPDAGQQLLPRM
jgi:site-specific DNA-cytosine methylase